MAAKGYRLYKFETIEVVEEGAKEEPGFLYEYLDSSPDELAASARPRRSSRLERPASRPVASRAAEKTPTPASSEPARPAAGRPDDEEAPTMEFDAVAIGTAAASASPTRSELSDAGFDGVTVVDVESVFDGDAHVVEVIEPDLSEVSDEVDEDFPFLSALDGDEGAGGAGTADEDLGMPDERDLGADLDKMPAGTREAAAAGGSQAAKGAKANGSKRGTARLDVGSRGRTAKVAGTGRTARGEYGRGGRPAAAPAGGKMSAKTARRVTIASYTVVAAVVLIIGGYHVLTELGILERPPSNAEQPNTGENESEEVRQMRFFLARAKEAHARAKDSFEFGEKAYRAGDREEFRSRAVQFLRHYWSVKFLIAKAGQINLASGASRFEDSRSQEAQSIRELTQMMRSMNSWIVSMGMNDVPDEPLVVNAKQQYDEVEAAIAQDRVEQGDVQAEVEQLIDEWLKQRSEVQSTIHAILTDSSTDVAGDARRLYHIGLTALTTFYRAVTLDPSQLTDTMRAQIEEIYRNMRAISDRQDTPSLDDPEFADARQAFDDARRAATQR